jgi:hypothetical protein
MSGRFSKVIHGHEDVFLKGSPEITYFRQLYNRTSLHEIYILDNNTSINTDYGSTIKVEVPQKGDILTSVFFKVIVPTDYISLWSAHTLVEYCDLLIGGQLIERVTTQFMLVNTSKLNTISENNSITGTCTSLFTKYVFSDAGITQLLITIPFYFYKKFHLGVPLTALQKHKVEIVIKLRPWEDLQPNNLNVGTTPIPLLVPSVPVEFIMVTDDIRQKIQKSALSYIITQNQLQSVFIPANTDRCITSLRFINPVHNLTMFFETIENIKKKVLSESNTFTNSCTTASAPVYNLIKKYGNALFVQIPVPPSYYIQKLHHLIDMKLEFNGEVCIDPDTSGSFIFLSNTSRLLNKNVSDLEPEYYLFGIYEQYNRMHYIHSFSENNTDENPGGQVNFSRISEKQMTINLVPSDKDRVLRIYAKSNNILKVRDGLGGLMFTSASDFNLSSFGYSQSVY